MAMCKDDLGVLTLSFENRCECDGCPREIRGAIMSYKGFKELKSMDYVKGTAEMIVTAETLKNPKKYCDWILKKARKTAKVVENAASTSQNYHGDNVSINEETIIYREFIEGDNTVYRGLRELEIRRRYNFVAISDI